MFSFRATRVFLRSISNPKSRLRVFRVICVPTFFSPMLLRAISLLLVQFLNSTHILRTIDRTGVNDLWKLDRFMRL